MSNFPAGSTPTEYEDWSRGDHSELLAHCPHCEQYTTNCECRFCAVPGCEDLAWDDKHDCCPTHELEAAVEAGDMELVRKWEVLV